MPKQSALPIPSTIHIKIDEWSKSQKHLKKLKKEELTLRKELFTYFFPNPKEGVNNYPLGNDYTLKGTFKLDRKLIEDEIQEAYDKMPDKEKIQGLIKTKPTLSIKIYKALSDNEKNIFDQALEIKDATPSLELVPPKEKK